MEEVHLPTRVRKSERFYENLEEFRSEIGTTDYGSTAVEIVEGLLNAARQAKDSVSDVLDAVAQFRNAVLDLDTREQERWYSTLIDREENIRRLITTISEMLDKVNEVLSS